MKQLATSRKHNPMRISTESFVGSLTKGLGNTYIAQPCGKRYTTNSRNRLIPRPEKCWRNIDEMLENPEEINYWPISRTHSPRIQEFSNNVPSSPSSPKPTIESLATIHQLQISPTPCRSSLDTKFTMVQISPTLWWSSPYTNFTNYKVFHLEFHQLIGGLFSHYTITIYKK